ARLACVVRAAWRGVRTAHASANAAGVGTADSRLYAGAERAQLHGSVAPDERAQPQRAPRPWPWPPAGPRLRTRPRRPRRGRGAARGGRGQPARTPGCSSRPQSSAGGAPAAPQRPPAAPGGPRRPPAAPGGPRRPRAPGRPSLSVMILKRARRPAPVRVTLFAGRADLGRHRSGDLHSAYAPRAQPDRPSPDRTAKHRPSGTSRLPPARPRALRLAPCCRNRASPIVHARSCG
ncbi:uncharacterized protein V1510DRAFT_437414, partial [Dipodascopsis tothii]|uniref:uncharacterized protein n=1 Tax=Dipodascopsis tothii TaxID=44089 RepID=UPI0034CD8F10